MSQLPDVVADPVPSGLVSVVIPAYNESERIEQNLLECAGILASLGYDFEIIAVDDGSHDDTHLAAVRAKSYHGDRIRIVRYDTNSGKGNALMCGSAYCRGEYVVFLDADLELHPSQLPRFFSILLSTGSDAVVGSKWHPESDVDYPRNRRICSATYYAMVKLLFGLPIRDTQTGLKVFKRAVLEAVLPRLLAKRFAFDIELLANAYERGFNIHDAPVSLRFARRLGRLKWGDVADVFLDTLAIFYRLRIRRYYQNRPQIPLQAMDCVVASREVLDGYESGVVAKGHERLPEPLQGVASVAL